MSAKGRPPVEHDLKVWPGDFAAIVEGRKGADIRRSDDRNFRVGDVLNFREWEPAAEGAYTGHVQRARVTHVDRMAGPRMLCAFNPKDAGDVVAAVVLSFGKI